MSEKDFSKNGNIPHVPEEQVDEAELLPPENNAAEGLVPEEQVDEAELLPPENNAAEGQAELSPTDETEEQTAEHNPVEAELSPTDEAEAEEQTAEHNPVEAESSPTDEPEGQAAECNTVEAEFSVPKKLYQRKAERQKAKCHPIEAILWPHAHCDEAEGHVLRETESKDSDHSPSLEGAVGSITDCGYDEVNFGHIQEGKEDIFEKFFSDEYDQANAPILGRRRHLAEKQRPRIKHESPDSKHSDENPLGCLQDAGTSGGAVLNQAGAIIGKYIPNEEIPEYARFGTEFGQSLPVIPTTEGSEHSLGSMSTARIGDLYGGTFSVISDLSYDSEEFGQRIPFLSFSSRPPTASSDNLETSPPDSNSPDKEQLPITSDLQRAAKEKSVRQRRSGIVTKPEQIRSKSALGGLLAYANESQDNELRPRKLSKDRSVRSEPLPQRKLSQDSSVDSSEQMNFEDEANYKELSDSSERDSSVPAPDSCTAVDRLEEDLGSLKIADIESATVVQNVTSDQNKASESSEQDPASANIESAAVVQNVALEHEIRDSETEQEPVTECCIPEAGVSKPQCE